MKMMAKPGLVMLGWWCAGSMSTERALVGLAQLGGLLHQWVRTQTPFSTSIFKAVSAVTTGGGDVHERLAVHRSLCQVEILSHLGFRIGAYAESVAARDRDAIAGHADWFRSVLEALAEAHVLRELGIGTPFDLEVLSRLLNTIARDAALGCGEHP